jgi:inner membrane protein
MPTPNAVIGPNPVMTTRLDMVLQCRETRRKRRGGTPDRSTNAALAARAIGCLQLSRARSDTHTVDFLTQTLLGAVAAQATMTRRLGRAAALVGAAGGALPDFDVLLRPLADPALPYELHRHFTHAFAFVPVGAALAAAPFMIFRRFRERAGAVYIASLVGIATHGPLDNLTSYGTHLFWPFLAHRTAWDAMSIIDPVFTIVLLLGVVAALAFRSIRSAQIALALGVCYIGFGFAQHARAAAVQRELAAMRGHEPVRARVMPTIGSVILWRSVYECDGRLFADAIRLPPLGSSAVRQGASIDRFDPDDLPETLDDPQRARLLYRRFNAFATGFTASVPGAPPGTILVGDVRFSVDTAGFDPIWGLRIAPADPDAPVRWTVMRFDDRTRQVMLSRLWSDLVGRGVGPATLEPLPAERVD